MRATRLYNFLGTHIFRKRIFDLQKETQVFHLNVNEKIFYNIRTVRKSKSNMLYN